jgi:hypothetical protein
MYIYEIIAYGICGIGILIGMIMFAIDEYDKCRLRNLQMVETFLNMSVSTFLGALVGVIFGIPFVCCLPIVLPIFVYKKYYSK